MLKADFKLEFATPNFAAAPLSNSAYIYYSSSEFSA